MDQTQARRNDGAIPTRLPRVQQQMKGLAMVMVAVFLFSLLDVLTKHLVQILPPTTVLAGRFIFGVVFMLALVYPRHGTLLFRVQRKRQVLLRSLMLPAASVLVALALQTLPVAETISMVYLAPFGVLVLSGLILREKVRLPSWLATVGGFLGLLLITRPGSGLDPLGVAFALTSAAVQVWYYFSSRLLAGTESAMALMFHASLAGAVIFGATLPFDPGITALGLKDLGLLALAGALGLGSHFLVTAAYHEAPAALVTPLLYVHLFWAGFMGWAFFGHVPDALAAAGIAIVAISGAGLALWNQRGARRAAR